MWDTGRKSRLKQCCKQIDTILEGNYELRERIDELDRSKPVYVICQGGLRSYIAGRILMGNGFDAYNFVGGYRFYDAVDSDQA